MRKMIQKKGSPLLASSLAAFCLAALAASASAGQGEKDAAAVVEKVQAYYEDIEGYRASFVQTTAHRLFPGRLERAYGKVMFKEGGLMRWEYERPQHKLFIYDGETLWVYEPEVPQIFTGSADKQRLEKGLAFLTGEGRILDEYEATRLDAEKFGFSEGIVLKLRPRDQRSPFRHVELYIDPDEHRVVRSVVVDHDGNRNRLDFSDVQKNPGLAAGLFRFEPPPGVPVIRAQR